MIKKLLIGSAITVACVAQAQAQANLMVLHVTGTAQGDVTHLGSGNGTFDMRLVYDSATPDLNPDLHIGEYGTSGSPAIKSWMLQFNQEPIVELASLTPSLKSLCSTALRAPPADRRIASHWFSSVLSKHLVPPVRPDLPCTSLWVRQAP